MFPWIIGQKALQDFSMYTIPRVSLGDYTLTKCAARPSFNYLGLRVYDSERIPSILEIVGVSMVQRFPYCGSTLIESSLSISTIYVSLLTALEPVSYAAC